MHGDRLRRRGSLREIERGQIVDFSWDFPSSMVDTVSAFRSMSTKPGQAQSSRGQVLFVAVARQDWLCRPRPITPRHAGRAPDHGRRRGGVPGPVASSCLSHLALLEEPRGCSFLTCQPAAAATTEQGIL